jgi:hypothetical protein
LTKERVTHTSERDPSLSNIEDPLLTSKGALLFSSNITRAKDASLTIVESRLLTNKGDQKLANNGCSSITNEGNPYITSEEGAAFAQK